MSAGGCDGRDDLPCCRRSRGLVGLGDAVGHCAEVGGAAVVGVDVPVGYGAVSVGGALVGTASWSCDYRDPGDVDADRLRDGVWMGIRVGTANTLWKRPPLI